MPIEVDQITYVYQPGSPLAWTALEGVSLCIEDGSCWGIIGATGSGKSTLIQHFNGLLHPTSGRVRVDGVDLAPRGTDLKRVRSQVGLVFQYPEQQLFAETVFEDIAFGPRNLGVPVADLPQRVAEAAHLVGLAPEILTRNPFDLSGGQARRVALAGVLAMRPHTLVLDEPTAGLDPEGRQALLQLVRRLHRQVKLTVVLISHSMDDVAEIAEQVLVLDRGRIAMQGSPRELFARASELEALGLGVPAAARLTGLLREQGWKIAPAVTLDEAVTGILAALKEGQGRV